MTKDPDLLGKTNDIITFLLGAASVTVLFGYPAIYVQARRFEIPFYLFSYKNIVYAGVIPGCIFFAFLLYSFWHYNKLRLTTRKAPISLVIIIIPFLPIVAVSMICFFSFPVYFLIGTVLHIIGWIAGSKPGNLFILEVTFCVFVIFILAGTLFSKRKKKQKTIDKNINQEPVNTGDHNGDLSAGIDKHDWTDLFDLLKISAFYTVANILGSFVLLWYLSVIIDDIETSNQLSNLFLIPLIVISIFYGIIFTISFIENRRLSFISFLIVAIILLSTFVYYYSVKWYPSIGQAFGGGQLEVMNILIEKDGIPEEYSGYETARFVRHQDYYLLFENDSHCIITKSDSNWIAVPKDKIISVRK